jgi:hypothetical protein
VDIFSSFCRLDVRVVCALVGLADVETKENGEFEIGAE